MGAKLSCWPVGIPPLTAFAAEWCARPGARGEKRRAEGEIVSCSGSLPPPPFFFLFFYAPCARTIPQGTECRSGISSFSMLNEECWMLNRVAHPTLVCVVVTRRFCRYPAKSWNCYLWPSLRWIWLVSGSPRRNRRWFAHRALQISPFFGAC